MSAPILFYSRCRPWEVDQQEVAIKHRCVFFGHFLRRAGAPYVREDPLSFLVSPLADEAEWRQFQRSSSNRGNKRAQTSNRRLANEVGPGSIVMVPRPVAGLIYCGRVKGPFRVSFDEARTADAEARFRSSQVLSKKGETCETIYASGELAQGWDIEGDWTKLPVPAVPAWIRRSLFGRSTYGVVDRERRFGDPVAVIADLMDRARSGGQLVSRVETSDFDEIKRRLKDTVTPNLLEGLAVSLLQVEEPHRAWVGVGGSGDGGVDGIASDADGHVTGLLQCKWAWDGEPVFTSETLWGGHGKSMDKYLAYFYPPMRRVRAPEGVTVLDLDTITALLIKHQAELPFARTIGVARTS